MAVRPHSPKAYRAPAPRPPTLDTGVGQGGGKGLPSRVQAFAVPPAHMWPSRGPLPLLSHSPTKSSWPWEIRVVLSRIQGSGSEAWRRSLPPLQLPGGLWGSGLPVCFSEWTPGGRRRPYSGSVRSVIRCPPKPSISSQPWSGCFFCPRPPARTSAWEPVPRCTSSASVWGTPPGIP